MVRSPQDLLKGHIQVPSLPRICVRLNEAVDNPRTSTLEIAELISNDAALTARLLKLVNSSFYGFPSKIATPSQAVMIIGTAHLCDLAFTTSITRLFKSIPEDLVSMESFWRHSVACGLAARVLAAYRREVSVERFFVAGILHDIGRLVVYQQVPALARDALTRAASESELLYRMERKVIGFDHAVMGAVLLRAWGLPSSLEESVAYHHNPTQALRFPVDAAVVHVADAIALAMELGSSGERFVPELDPEAWEILELRPSILSDVLTEVEEQFEDVSRAFLAEDIE